MTHLLNFLVIQGIQIHFEHFVRVVVDLIKQLAKLGNLTLLIEHFADALTEALGSRTQMGFEYLTNVHPRRDAQRVQDDVNGITVHIVRHVLNRHDRGDNTLVTVTAGHLVARLDTTLDSKIDLNDFQDTRCKIITLLELAFFVVKARIVFFLALLKALLGFLQQLIETFILHAQLEPV